MSMQEAERIRAVWDALEEMDDDISTERLAAMTADAAKVDAADVFEALAMTEEDEE